MSITVKDIMKLEVFENAKIIAGHSGINKEVSSATVAEVPDASDWLKGGEIVATTGYFIKDDYDFQKKWMEDLINDGASALAIKTDRFIGQIPELMKEIANKNSFCLIELPIDVTWPVIIESVLNYINDNNSQIIKKVKEIHTRLTKVILEGHDLSFIAKIIGQLVDNIIIVEDASLENLAIACQNYSVEATEDFLDYRLSTEYKERFKSIEYYNSVLKNTNRRSFILDIGEFNDKHKGLSQIIIPIVADDTLYGFISLVEFYKKANKIDMIALEHGATTIALELMKEKVTIETEKRMKRSFLDDLLEGRINTTETKVEKYKDIKYDITKPSVAIFIEVSEIKNMPGLDNKLFYVRSSNKVFEIIRNNILNYDPEAFIYGENNKFVVLYHFKISNDKNEIVDDIKELCERISKGIDQEYPGASYNFGIGNIYFNLENLKRSYIEAKNALEIGNTFIGFNQVHFYNDLGIYRILFTIEHQEVINFYNDTLENLKDYDKQNSENLCECLEQFLINNGNISQTSKDLFVHQNTLSYRLKKISGILGKDINDSKVRFNLYFAFLIKKILIDRKYLNR